MKMGGDIVVAKKENVGQTSENVAAKTRTK
jgi:hypothetical protein